MDIMELGAIGELVGGVAVIASLIYVGIQVRQSNENTRQSLDMEKSAASRETGSQFTELMMATTDASLMAAVQQATVDWDSLPHLDKGRVSMWMQALEIQCLTVFLGGRSDLMDKGQVEAWTAYFASFVKSPGLRKWWLQTKIHYHVGFVDEIDRRLAEKSTLAAIHEGFPWLGAEASG